MPSDSVSYAMYILVNIVSPPTGGMVIPRSSEPSDGTRVNDMSECQS